MNREQVRAQLQHVLDKTNFDFLGERYEGKVRDNYTRGAERIIITTDRLSCFDVVVTTVPWKGQVLTDVALEWFKRTNDIISNHLIDSPHPNAVVVKNCEVLPVEVVMRAYLAGSAWRDYAAGRPISGITLPPGLKASARLPEPLLTPSTKEARGKHDEPIAEREIISRGIVSEKLWSEVREVAFALFKRGQEFAAKQGLLLVDTKYEFGLLKGKLTLVDEIHTLDSSRYWEAGTYQQHFEAGTSPEMLDKEPVRQWLLSKGYKGEGTIPTFTDDYRIDIALHYLHAANRILGRDVPVSVGQTLPALESSLRRFGVSNEAGLAPAGR